MTPATERIRMVDREHTAPGPYRDAFELAPLPMALVGPDDRIHDANAAMCRLTGYGPDDLAVRTVAALTHPEERHEAVMSRRAVVRRTKVTSTVEARILRSDGTAVWASISCSLLGDEHGRPDSPLRGPLGPDSPLRGPLGPDSPLRGPLGPDSPLRGPLGPSLIVQMVDISAHKNTEQDLARSNAELGSFAYLAAHELKSPLQTLSGFTALLDRAYGPRLEPRARECVSWIANGAARMDALIEALLAYCSVDIEEITLGPVALDEVAAEVVGHLDRAVQRAGAVITVEPLPVVTADRVQLGQVLQNLVTNALKFVPEGRRPRVHVSAEHSGDGWTVTVADNGIGVEEAARDRIFDMFERLHPRERYDGTGIGLSICKRVVERRGGTIWVEPDPGGGSRFRFRIPDVLAPAAPAA